MASSTAWAFSTGREPGRPKHTGQTFVLGSPPKALAHPQKSLVSVLSSVWTSRPTTIDQPSGSTLMSPSRLRRPSPLGTASLR